MAKKRTNFTDAQKAKIFVRDHATCAFSGKSLWILDYGATPLWDMDWVDHKRPSAWKGKAELGNGICASYTFNSKKNSNSRDTTYFFENGRPTEAYFDYYGALPPAMRRQLRRLSKLMPSDWYFNRCLADVFIGFYYKVDRSRPRPRRTDKYWFNAGWKHLQKYQILTAGKPRASMEGRGILLNPDRTDVKMLLDLRTVRTRREFLERLALVYPTFKENCSLYWDFWSAKSLEKRDAALAAAQKAKLCSPLILDAIRSHHAYFKAIGSAPSAQPRRAMSD